MLDPNAPEFTYDPPASGLHSDRATATPTTGGKTALGTIHRQNEAITGAPNSGDVLAAYGGGYHTEPGSLDRVGEILNPMTHLRNLGAMIEALGDGGAWVGDQVLPGSGPGVRNVIVVGSILVGPGRARAVTTTERVAVVEARIALTEFEAFMKARGLPAGREAEKAWEVYQRSKASKGLLIGPKDAVAEAVANGMDKLRFEPGWSWNINKAWLDGAIASRLPVRILGDLERIGKAIQAGKTNVLTDEIRYLLGKGYKLVGDTLMPP